MPRKNPKIKENRRTRRKLGRKAYGRFQTEIFHKEESTPLKIGSEYNLLISDSNRRGQGIGYLNGIKVFVTGAEPGEEIRVKIRKITSSYAVGDPV